MFTDLEFIKACLNGLRNRIENLSKEIDKKISYNLEVSKADWNQNDETAADYVKNRTHYDSRVTEEINITEEIAVCGTGRYKSISNELWKALLNKESTIESEYGTFVFEGEILQGNRNDLSYVSDSSSLVNALYVKKSEAMAYFLHNSAPDGAFVKNTVITCRAKVVSGKIQPLDEKFIPESIVADWNENDETKLSYIKNRPFYTGDPVENVFVEESTVSFVDNDGLYQAEFPSTFEATVGETYKVSWDGTVYECTCTSFSNALIIGNLSIIGAGSDTGEPFLIGILNGEGIVIITADTSASHTFSISETVTPVVKIDKKYLVQPDWNQNDETAADFVKNRPMYSYQENIGTEYSISNLTANPLPLVLGEEWYVMGKYVGKNDQYLPDGTKTIFTVEKNSSGDLCIASDSFEFSTGSEAGIGNRFVIYSDHIYQNNSWKNVMSAEVLSVYRLAESSYKIAYKTIEPDFLPKADGETAGIVNPDLNSGSATTPVVVNEDGRLYCNTKMPVLTVSSTLKITLDWSEINFMPFLMFYTSNTVTNAITINGNSYKIYVNGTQASIPPNSGGSLFLAVADASGRKLHLVKNPI